jgi:hypothetical protein
MELGNPSKRYTFDIVTGISIMWVACKGCRGCSTKRVRIHSFINHIKKYAHVNNILSLFLISRWNYTTPDSSSTSSRISCSVIAVNLSTNKDLESAKPNACVVITLVEKAYRSRTRLMTGNTSVVSVTSRVCRPHVTDI